MTLPAWRNASFTADDLITCEVQHPVLDWIPFTVDPADLGAFCDAAALDAAIRAAGTIAAYVPPPVTAEQVDAERDRRIVANFTFGGTAYDFDAASKARITGMGTLAGFALAGGFGAGNLRWADASVDFVWIASDNTPVPMDAPTCFAFAKAAAAHESAHIFHARAIKSMSPIPADFTANGYWP